MKVAEGTLITVMAHVRQVTIRHVAMKVATAAAHKVMVIPAMAKDIIGTIITTTIAATTEVTVDRDMAIVIEGWTPFCMHALAHRIGYHCGCVKWLKRLNGLGLNHLTVKL